MANTPENPISSRSKTVGGRQFGQVHEPTQAQEASGNAGLADNAGMHSDEEPGTAGKSAPKTAGQEKRPSRKTA
jgi:hypothetical protein